MNTDSNEFLVSLIVPVYSERPYIHEALDSVINQTYNNLEIIIIDDGSIDGSGEIADEYAKKDKRITVLHQENKGLATVRNIGVSMATGDAICFFDSDDALAPDYVKAMADAMLQTQADLVVCKYTIDKTEGLLVRNGRIEPPIESGLYDRISALQALADNKINTHVWNKLYKKALFKNVNFPAGRLYEDVATTFKLFDLSKTVCVLGDPLYLHRKRKGSITGSKKGRSDLAWAYSQFTSFIEQNTPNIFTIKQLNRHRRRSDLF